MQERPSGQKPLLSPPLAQAPSNQALKPSNGEYFWQPTTQLSSRHGWTAKQQPKSLREHLENYKCKTRNNYSVWHLQVVCLSSSKVFNIFHHPLILDSIKNRVTAAATNAQFPTAQRLPAVTSGYQRLPAVTSGYQRLPAVTSGYQRLPAASFQLHVDSGGSKPKILSAVLRSHVRASQS